MLSLLSLEFYLQSLKQRTLRKRKLLRTDPISPPVYVSLPYLITNSGRDCAHNTHAWNAHAHDERRWHHPQHSAPTPASSWSRSGHATTTRTLLNIPKVKQGRRELPDAHHPGQPWGSEHLTSSHHLAHLAICGPGVAAQELWRQSLFSWRHFSQNQLIFSRCALSFFFITSPRYSHDTAPDIHFTQLHHSHFLINLHFAQDSTLVLTASRHLIEHPITEKHYI